jgi:hypothetical protein
MRRLPGHADSRLGKGSNSGGSLRIVSGLAENTNSIFCDGSSEPETANGCPVLHGQEPPAERHWCARRHPDQIECALSRARPETSCFSLDFDLHGCRLIVPLSPS